MNDEDNEIAINGDVNTAKIDTSNGNGSSMFAANNLYQKTADNLAQAESMVNEVPLRTDKTIELEEKERESSE